MRPLPSGEMLGYLRGALVNSTRTPFQLSGARRHLGDKNLSCYDSSNAIVQSRGKCGWGKRNEM